jgi:hypothetical protein
MNARKTFLGLAGVALIAATGLFAAACGSSSPNNPAPTTGSSGTSSGSGATSGATASGASAGTSAGASGASSSGTTTADGGVDATAADGGDGAAPTPEAAACNPTGAVYPSDACAPCAANLLNACSTFNVTCTSFDNTTLPDAHF